MMATQRTVFITGGNRGLGFETARQMAKLNYYVIIGSRDNATAQAALTQLRAHEGKYDAVAIDVTSEPSVKAAAAQVSTLCNGVLDALINNAGYSAHSGKGEQVNLDELRKTFEINVVGAVCVTNHFLDMVKRAPAGRIVNVSSIMGSLQNTSISLATCPYNVSKAALNMYTVNLARALQQTNVKVNSAHPGWVKTDMGGPSAPLDVDEGAATSVYLATLPSDGPTGGFFHKQTAIPW